MSSTTKTGLLTPTTTRLSDAMFEQLRTLIHEKTGIVFQEHKRYLLENRVGQRLRELGLKDFSAYWDRMQGISGISEMVFLINAVTINETSFFRSPQQLEVLETILIPEVIRNRQKDFVPRVRIWSAACSSGEEPYSIAMLVHGRLQSRFPNVRFEVMGTDIDTDVLRKAHKGEYTDYSVRNVPPQFRSYFQVQSNRYTLKPEIRNLVRFKQQNLMDRTTMQSMTGFDIIFCANVLIYFDKEGKQNVMSYLAQSMLPGGYLFVGSSETLYDVTQSFKAVRTGNILIYKKQ